MYVLYYAMRYYASGGTRETAQQANELETNELETNQKEETPTPLEDYDF